MSRWTADGCRLNEFALDDLNGDILRMAADSVGRIIVPEHLDNKVFYACANFNVGLRAESKEYVKRI